MKKNSGWILKQFLIEAKCADYGFKEKNYKNEENEKWLIRWTCCHSEFLNSLHNWGWGEKKEW